MSQWSTSQAPVTASGPTSSAPTQTPFFQTGGWGAIQSALNSFLGGLGTGLTGQMQGQQNQQFAPPPPPPERKDNTLLFVGIGIAVLIVVVILVVVLKKK
jgi:hypothetical protein